MQGNIRFSIVVFSYRKINFIINVQLRGQGVWMANKVNCIHIRNNFESSPPGSKVTYT